MKLSLIYALGLPVSAPKACIADGKAFTESSRCSVPSGWSVSQAFYPG